MAFFCTQEGELAQAVLNILTLLRQVEGLGAQLQMCSSSSSAPTGGGGGVVSEQQQQQEEEILSVPNK
jgi:hypothetical protein